MGMDEFFMWDEFGLNLLITAPQRTGNEIALNGHAALSFH